MKITPNNLLNPLKLLQLKRQPITENQNIYLVSLGEIPVSTSPESDFQPLTWSYQALTFPVRSQKKLRWYLEPAILFWVVLYFASILRRENNLGNRILVGRSPSDDATLPKKRTSNLRLYLPMLSITQKGNQLKQGLMITVTVLHCFPSVKW